MAVNFSEPQFPHIRKGGNNTAFPGLLRKLGIAVSIYSLHISALTPRVAQLMGTNDFSWVSLDRSEFSLLVSLLKLERQERRCSFSC